MFQPFIVMIKTFGVNDLKLHNIVHISVFIVFKLKNLKYGFLESPYISGGLMFYNVSVFFYCYDELMIIMIFGIDDGIKHIIYIDVILFSLRNLK